MKYIFFSIILLVLDIILIFLSKYCIYKIFESKNQKINFYFSSLYFTLISFGIFFLFVYIISKGDGFILSDNLSSFSYVYFIFLVLFIVINFICENKFYKEKRFVYFVEKKKRSRKKS